MNKIIIAPHADDEVIGCFRILNADCHVIFTKPSTLGRQEEARCLEDEIHHSIAWIDSINDLSAHLDRLDLAGAVIIAPDRTEHHPAHVAANFFAHQEAQRRILRFMTYTTSMNVPYVEELSEEERLRKREMLNRFYPSQSSLWANDHRYFLFEGLCEWSPNV